MYFLPVWIDQRTLRESTHVQRENAEIEARQNCFKLLDIWGIQGIHRIGELSEFTEEKMMWAIQYIWLNIWEIRTDLEVFTDC